VDTVMRGGDTDTNAAIAGALFGAVHGLDAVPEQWRDKLLNCRPEAGRPHVRHPRMCLQGWSSDCSVHWYGLREDEGVAGNEPRGVYGAAQAGSQRVSPSGFQAGLELSRSRRKGTDRGLERYQP